jgi:hypothetical protein
VTAITDRQAIRNLINVMTEMCGQPWSPASAAEAIDRLERIRRAIEDDPETTAFTDESVAVRELARVHEVLADRTGISSGDIVPILRAALASAHDAGYNEGYEDGRYNGDCEDGRAQ